jgi:hypothetical protein
MTVRPEMLERERRLFTMNEVAGQMRVSRRWLQDFIQVHPYYRMVGRKKLFTPEDINRLIESLPVPKEPVWLKRRRARAGAAPQTRSQSNADALAQALALAREKRRR